MAESYVGKPCPKCRHVRTANEVAPDWQCPKCGVAYAKAAGAQSAPAAAPVGMSVTQQIRAGQTLKGVGADGSTGLAMFVHLSILIGFIVPFFGLIVPVVVWVTKKDSDDLATSNAKEAINFQITMFLWAVLIVGLALFGMKALALLIAAGLLGLAFAIAYVVLPIIAAVKANGGDQYRYPFTVHIFG